MACSNLLTESHLVFFLHALETKTKTPSDKADLLPVCYKCGYENKLIRFPIKCNLQIHANDSCVSCGHPFLRCYLTFDILPLVEFAPMGDITHEEALDLILTSEADSESSTNMFDECIHHSVRSQSYLIDEINHIPVAVSPDVLRTLSRETVFAMRVSCMQTPRTNDTTIGSGKDERSYRFFKNILPEIGIAMCPTCQHFFHEEDFEFSVLRDGGCPFCRSAAAMSQSVSCLSFLTDQSCVCLDLRVLKFRPYFKSNLILGCASLLWLKLNVPLDSPVVWSHMNICCATFARNIEK